MRTAWLAGALLLGAFASTAAEIDPALPHYLPRPVAFPSGASYVTPAGAIAIIGYNDMEEMLRALDARFAAVHPGFRFALKLKGTRTAPGALAQGRSAFAPMGAEFSPAERTTYRAATGGEPLSFRIAHASLHGPALSGPLAIIVHPDNPLPSLTLGQVAQVFGGQVKAWGGLGLAGQWAGQAVHPSGLNPETALGIFLRTRVLGRASFTPDLMGYAQSADVVKRVAADPLAIGFAAAVRATAGVRIVAIAASPHEAPVALNEESIRAGRYPLDRYLLIYVRQPIEPFVGEYLRLVLSSEGQRAIADGTLGYLPLNAGEIAAERAKLR